jgi:hypothetical protein
MLHSCCALHTASSSSNACELQYNVVCYPCHDPRATLQQREAEEVLRAAESRQREAAAQAQALAAGKPRVQYRHAEYMVKQVSCTADILPSLSCMLQCTAFSAAWLRGSLHQAPSVYSLVVVHDKAMQQ